MAEVARSFFSAPRALHRTRPKSAEQVAVERWAGRQGRLAYSVAAILGEVYGDEWTWEVSDTFLGIPTDAPIFTGLSPNGDGTHSGVMYAGWDPEILASILQSMGPQHSGATAVAATIHKHPHWSDPFWGPFPAPYHPTYLLEENDMPLSIQDKQDIKAMISEGVADALKDCSIPVGKLAFSTGNMIALGSFIIASAFIIGGAVLSVRGEVSEVKVEMAALSTKFDERLPPKQDPAPTSTNTGLPTPDTATGGSPSPQ